MIQIPDRPDDRVILTVWCGQCAAERRRDRGRLGVVLGVVAENLQGGLVWLTWDQHRARLNDRPGAQWRGWRGGVTLSHPAFSTLDIPERLPALCEHHGRGELLTADVIGRRGSLTLDLIAAA